MNPRKNTVFERYRFWEYKQQEGETIDQFITELKTRARSFEFGVQHDSMIRDRIVFGVSDTRLKERLLRESSDLTLEKAVSLCRTAKASKNQLKELHSSETKPVHGVKSKSKLKSWKKPRQQQAFNCKKCGTKHLSKACPPFGRPCLFWKRKLLRQNVSAKESSRPPGRFKQACRQWWKSRVRGTIYRDIDWPAKC